jgi:chromosome segregation ATPase
MKLTKLTLKNFGLFRDIELIPQSINLIRGINYDNPKDSSNGCGKSTLFKLAILFLLFGETCGKKLERTISFGHKNAEVEGEIIHGNNTIKIIRKIPTKLQVFVNGIDKEFNSPTIAQNYLNEIFGDYTFFKKYCLVDTKSINLLDSLDDSRSIVSFKKELMAFIDTEFAPHRESLLAKKNERELYSVDKRLYKFHLSKKRLEILESGLKRIQEELNNVNKDRETQQESINKLNGEIKSTESKIEFFYEQENDVNNSMDKNNNLIVEYQNKIQTLKNQPTKSMTTPIDYDSQLTYAEKEAESLEQELKELEKKEDLTKKDIEKINFQIHSTENDLTKYNNDKGKLNKEITGLDNVKIGTKCDRCGSLVSVEYRDSYRKDKTNEIENITKKEIILKNSLNELKNSLDAKNNELKSIINWKTLADDNIAVIKKDVKELNDKKFSQAEEIKKIEFENSQVTANINKYQELIETYNKQLNEYNCKISEAAQGIIDSKNKIEETKIKLDEEKNCIDYYNDLYLGIQKKETITKDCIMKLKEAFKFSDYKYTKEDIQLYSDSIKTLDLFSGYYIQEWMNNLSFIINDLLKDVNLSIKLTEEKEFLKIKDGDKELTYADLSDGQRIFFSGVFKLAILLQKGESDRIIIMDDGLGAIDFVNFKNLINICKNLPMQIFGVYQNCPEIEEINYINIERKNGESNARI